jgi:hypothetical protein
MRKNSSKRERETTSQRAAREYARRTTLCHAKEVAELITARRRNKEDMAPEDMMEVLLYWGDIWGPDIERAYVSFGRVVCELEKNPPRFLRLVADLLEGKHPYSPGADWYDDKITAASDRRRLPPLCGAIISETKTAIATANSVRFITPRQGSNHNAPGYWKGNRFPGPYHLVIAVWRAKTAECAA